MTGDAPPRNSRVSKEHQKQWIDLYVSGLSCGEIGRVYGRSDAPSTQYWSDTASLVGLLAARLSGFLPWSSKGRALCTSALGCQ